MEIRITINGSSCSVPPGLTISGLLSHLGIEGDRIAVELNRTIVRKAEWASTLVEESASIEIVTFVGGG